MQKDIGIHVAAHRCLVCTTSNKPSTSAGPRWCSCLRLYVISWKVAGSDPSGSIMAVAYQGYFLGVKAIGPYSCADCLEIWEPQPRGVVYIYNTVGQSMWDLRLKIEVACNITADVSEELIDLICKV